MKEVGRHLDHKTWSSAHSFAYDIVLAGSSRLGTRRVKSIEWVLQSRAVPTYLSTLKVSRCRRRRLKRARRVLSCRLIY